MEAVAPPLPDRFRTAVVACDVTAISGGCIDIGGNGAIRDDSLTAREKPGLVF
jgi:hypothetical protein